ncbi:MAG: TolC family protein [Xanthomonadales bacterium]|nr:TolC family protein [Xanthomonadales bacterium]
MYTMRKVICHTLIVAWTVMAIGLGWYENALANQLDLSSAETIALQKDPSVSSLESRASALEELEVAAGQLPDPTLKFGAMSLPTDTFNLGQEAMTQVQLGVVQTFPRGQTLALRSAQIREHAGALGEKSRDMALQIRRTVREEFLEVLKQQHLFVINAKAEAAFVDLDEITQDYYATGRVPQQDVLGVAVELARVKERSLRISEDEQKARGRLAAFIKDSAWRTLEPEWPVMDLPAAPEQIKRKLKVHPRIQALHHEAVAAQKGIELADQNYKPEFALDLTYAGRSGVGNNGRDRPDLLSLMVRMDIPLFTSRRQDRVRAASVAQSNAVAFDRDDAHRALLSEVEVQYHAWQRQQERLVLFERYLLPQAESNAQASFDAYQAALADMTTLTRAQIIEFDLQLEHVRLKAESLKSQARLLYLEGK